MLLWNAPDDCDLPNQFYIFYYLLFIMVWLCTSGELNAQAVGYRE